MTVIDTDKPSWIGEAWGEELPPNWKRISAKEFAQHTRFGSYTPEWTGYAQLCTQKGKPWVNAHLFTFFDKTGVGIVTSYWDTPHVRLYSFSTCEHEYEERGIGKCLHEWKCKKCGFVQVVDSSD